MSNIETAQSDKVRVSLDEFPLNMGDKFRVMRTTDGKNSTVYYATLMAATSAYEKALTESNIT